MPTIQQTLTEPSPGADRARVQAFLDFLATHLAADDFARATTMLWGAFHPHALNREAS